MYRRCITQSLIYRVIYERCHSIFFNMLLLYILWDDWPIFMISGSNEHLQLELEYTLEYTLLIVTASEFQKCNLDVRKNDMLYNYVLNLPRKRMECFRLLFNHLAWIERQFLSGIRDSRKAGSLLGMMRGEGGVRKSVHKSWLAKGLGLVLLRWGFKGVQEEIPLEEATTRLSGIYTRTMHQSTTPSLSQTIWPRWASRQFLTLPIAQTLLPVTFAYSLGPEVVVIRRVRRWKRLWRRSLTRSHKRISMGPLRSCWNGTTSALKLEEITSKGTRISCMYYQ